MSLPKSYSFSALSPSSNGIKTKSDFLIPSILTGDLGPLRLGVSIKSSSSVPKISFTPKSLYTLSIFSIRSGVL